MLNQGQGSLRKSVCPSPGWTQTNQSKSIRPKFPLVIMRAWLA